MEQHGNHFDREESGFSLIELIIYMALLGILMTMVFSSFIPVMRTGSRQWRIGETKIETGVGLELLRSDLEHAGFGLPWEFMGGVTPIPYFEPADAAPPGAPAALADVPKVPRAVISEDTSAFSMNAADYLTIKALNVTTSDTTQKWGLLWRLGNATHDATVQSLSDKTFVATEHVIVIRPRVALGEDRQLVMSGTDYFAHPTTADLAPFAPPMQAYDPNGDRYLVYGLVNVKDPRRPFNRTDYYINAPTALNPLPAQCAPGTGTLEKAVLNHEDDDFLLLPIVDCVADFQVVYYLDTDGDGGWDTRVNASGLNGLTAQQIREQVKSIRCYVLTHEGGVDPTYTHPTAIINVGEVDTDGVTLIAGRAFDVSTLTGIGTTWANYRWKVYSLAVTPRNLQ
jgi:prepilin-type N-terminal cleavage/methylation domain-containing protein